MKTRKEDSKSFPQCLQRVWVGLVAHRNIKDIAGSNTLGMCSKNSLFCVWISPNKSSPQRKKKILLICINKPFVEHIVNVAYLPRGGSKRVSSCKRIMQDIFHMPSLCIQRKCCAYVQYVAHFRNTPSRLYIKLFICLRAAC